MLNKLGLAALAVSLLGGVAMAQPRDRGGDRDRGGERDRGRVIERGRDRVITPPRREYHPDRHVYVNRDNRFTFRGDVYRPYHRPVIRERYRDWRVRPRVIVESYDPMPGYEWMPGAWQWNGVEWLWFGGHYVIIGEY